MHKTTKVAPKSNKTPRYVYDGIATYDAEQEARRADAIELCVFGRSYEARHRPLVWPGSDRASIGQTMTAALCVAALFLAYVLLVVAP